MDFKKILIVSFVILTPFMMIAEAWSQCSTKTYYYKSYCGGSADPGYNYLGVPLVPGRSSLSSAAQACESDAKNYLTENWVNKSSTYAIFKISNITSITPWERTYRRYVNVNGKSYTAIIDFTNVYTWASGEFLPPRFPNGGRKCTGTSCVSQQYWAQWVPSGGVIQGVTWEDCPPFDDPNDKKYTIKLSTVTAQPYGAHLAAIQPDGIYRKPGGKEVPEKLINKVHLVAEVKDQDGNPVNAAIKLKVTSKEGSGGHHQAGHATRNPLNDTDLNPLKAGTLQAGTLDSHTITIPSGGMVNGIVEFVFTAPDVSGNHVIEASCVDITCEQIGRDSVWVGIKGLTNLPVHSNYVFTGKQDEHGENHYATPRVIEKIQAIADDYHAWFPSAPVLRVNDISLEYGGLYDVLKNTKGVRNWKQPHNLHRTGEDVDVRANGSATAIPAENVSDFKFLAQTNGCVAVFHGSGTNRHLHLHCTQKQGK